MPLHDDSIDRRRRHLIALAASSLAVPAWAQDAWPSKPMRMIVGYAAGSGIDAAARQLAHSIEKLAGQTIIVDNRAGALGNIGAQVVASAPGDPYTFLFTPNSTHAANVHLFKKLPFDPVKDFTPVSQVATLGFVLICDPKALQATNLQQLIAQAKREPGKLAYGSGNATGLVAGELFKTMAGVDVLGVPYKSVPPAVTDLLGGQVQMVFADATLAIPLVKSGKVRALGVTSAKRIVALPEVPSFAEQGLAGYDLSGWFAVFLPAGVPAAVTAKLAGYVRTALNEPTLANYLRGIGAEPQSSTPEGLARLAASDTEKWGKLIQLAGITPE